MDNRRGQATVLAVVTVAVISVLGGSLLNHSFATSRENRMQQLQAEALYLAEGGLEDASGRFAQAIANFQIDPNAPCYPVADPCGSVPLITTFANGATASSVVEEAEALPRTISDPDDVSFFVKNYHVTTTVTMPGSSVQVRLHQIVERRVIFTFQHAIFYDQDLEWLPGADMTLSGRVHSNADLYINTHATLTVNTEYFRAAGKMYNHRKDDPSAPMFGAVEIKKAGTSSYPLMAGLDSDSGTWFTESQTRWNGTVKAGVHGVTQRAVPAVGSITPGGFYDSNANVKVVNGTITKNGVTLISGSTMPPNTITTNTTFYNNREAKYVKMTNINLRKLAGYHDCDNDGDEEQCYPNNLPSNGLLYATRNDVPGSQQPGIRLTNGGTIHRAGGLTVVSNAPIYMQGNYNTSSKKPAAVIADAVNILSNAWSDANSVVNNVNSGTPRTATATTVNAAFIAGVENTTVGQYNGGLENYPRFHERWSGTTLNITGSFVSLWESQIANGNWTYGQLGSNSQYTAPNRNWNYDTAFSSGTAMPPFTPFAVEMIKGAWWKE